MEYLKNVVLRFLTFTNPQEKAQLLPVLSQMLKLSQEEQNAIMSKGNTKNQVYKLDLITNNNNIILLAIHIKLCLYIICLLFRVVSLVIIILPTILN